MTLVDMKASTFLVREEGFDLETPSVVFAGWIAVGEIGDQVKRFFITTAPLANQVQRHFCTLRKTDLMALEHLPFCHRAIPDRLALLAFLNINLW
jgi:hypothetical protein